MDARMKDAQRHHRHHRVRSRIHGTAERPRLVVFKSLKHFTAQLIDDDAGRTLCAATDHEMKEKKTGKEASVVVGTLLAEKAKKHGITKAVFDRAGYRYHGRIAAFADAVRAGGIEF